MENNRKNNQKTVHTQIAQIRIQKFKLQTSKDLGWLHLTSQCLGSSVGPPFLTQLPANTERGRQQMMAHGSTPLSPTGEPWLDLNY